jgi:hypothetical protein
VTQAIIDRQDIEKLASMSRIDLIREVHRLHKIERELIELKLQLDDLGIILNHD